jgi:hypothetical protein
MNNIEIVEINIPYFFSEFYEHERELSILSFYIKILERKYTIQREAFKKDLESPDIKVSKWGDKPAADKLKAIKNLFKIESVNMLFQIKINNLLVGLLLFSEKKELKIILKPGLIKNLIKNGINLEHGLSKDVLIKFIEKINPGYFFSCAQTDSECLLLDKALEEWIVESDYKEYKSQNFSKDCIDFLRYRFFSKKSDIKNLPDITI